MPRKERAIQRIRARESKAALYAVLDDNNVVIRLYEILRQDMLDADGNESDFLGKMWWKENYGPNSCISTPPNPKIMKTVPFIARTSLAIVLIGIAVVTTN